MLSVREIKATVADEMKLFEKKFKESMKSNVSLLDKITHYIIKRKGKQIRPMFVFLSAKIFGEVTEHTYHAASLIELLHTATLVHDDVVDDANERRGFFSINALWKNKIAVLVGDFLLSKGLLHSVDNNEFELLRIVSNAVREMSEGELLQMEKARKLDITEEVYYEIIRQKTAALIQACCAAGAASQKVGTKQVKQMALFGEKVGMAFQIKDDLFDYGAGKNIGKPTGIDIKERKMTLPLIYCLNNCNKNEKREIINTIKNHNNKPKRVAEIIKMVQEKGGIEYAAEKMKGYKEEALEILLAFDKNPARDALESLVEYTIDRDR